MDLDGLLEPRPSVGGLELLGLSVAAILPQRAVAAPAADPHACQKTRGQQSQDEESHAQSGEGELAGDAPGICVVSESGAYANQPKEVGGRFTASRPAVISPAAATFPTTSLRDASTPRS